MSDLPYDLWEPVIGLEIHAQLNTKSKLFSRAPNRFGDEPNTNISVFCTGRQYDNGDILGFFFRF